MPEGTQVVLTKCADYEAESVSMAIRYSLEPFGGIGAFVKSGHRVLLKPNLLSAKDPARAITTHPVVVEEVARLVRDAGGEPFIGDSPGGAIRGIKRVWENTGMKEMAERSSLELVNFEASGSEEVKSGPYTYYIAKPVREADVIINLPKLKTHSLTLLTCAVKNMFGTIPGFRKAEAHKLNPKPVEFAQMLVHLYRVQPPQLSIVDAITAMDGNGPSAGNPFDLGLIVAGSDGVAIDTVVADRIGFPEDFIDTTRIAGDMGLGEKSLDRISITGSGADIRAEGFELPSNRVMRLIPSPLIKLITPLVWVKPVIDPNLCTGCAFCFKSCPVKAIDKDGSVYRIDDERCINCLCCHELCPDRSIEIKLSWLAKRWA